MAFVVPANAFVNFKALAENDMLALGLFRASLRLRGLSGETLRRGKVPGFKSGGYVGSGSVGRYISRPGVNDGGLRVQVVKGDLFDVIVDGRAAKVAAPMVVTGAQAASAGAQKAMERRGSRRLG